jgi:hypothetical protein
MAEEKTVNIRIKEVTLRGDTYRATDGVHLPAPSGTPLSLQRKLEPGEIVAVHADVIALREIRRLFSKDTDVLETTKEPATRPLVFPNAIIAQWSAPGAKGKVKTFEQSDNLKRADQFLEDFAKDQKRV